MGGFPDLFVGVDLDGGGAGGGFGEAASGDCVYARGFGIGTASDEAAE